MFARSTDTFCSFEDKNPEIRGKSKFKEQDTRITPRRMEVIKRNGVLGQLPRDPWLVFSEDRVYDCLAQVDMTDNDAGHPHQM